VTAEMETKQIRTRVLLGFARIIVLILTAVVVFRIAVPYLFNLHTNLGLFSAVAVGLVGLAALIWLAFDFITSFRRKRRP
jgi:hypothetical protein